jgi:hypothetical protein
VRDYLSEPNLFKAAVWSVPLTALSVPRLLAGQYSLWLYAPALFGCLLFVCAAATAWGDRGGLPGLLPEWRRVRPALLVALAATLLLAPLYAFAIDPLFRRSLLAAGAAPRLALAYPGTLAAWVGLTLWSAGFQNMFLHAAPLSLFARLLGRRWPAILLTVAVRLYIQSRQIHELGIADNLPLYYLSAGGLCLIACLLFSRGGFVPTAVFAVGTNLHLLRWIGGGETAP